MRFTFNKSEKLRSKKSIEALFGADAFKIHSGSFRMAFIRTSENTQDSQCNVLIAVSKKNFSTAVSRNRIRRQLRELYRLNKHILTRALEEKNIYIALLISYSSKKQLVFNDAKTDFLRGLKQVANDITKDHTISIPAPDKNI